MVLRECSFRCAFLTYCTVSGLSEISALCMFGVGFSGNQQYPQIREFGTGQHTHMTFFLQMRQDQPLPVTVQHVLAAQRGKLQSTAPLPGSSNRCTSA